MTKEELDNNRRSQFFSAVFGFLLGFVAAGLIACMYWYPSDHDRMQKHRTDNWHGAIYGSNPDNGEYYEIWVPPSEENLLAP